MPNISFYSSAEYRKDLRTRRAYFSPVGSCPTFSSHNSHFMPTFRSLTLCQVLSGGRQKQMQSLFLTIVPFQCCFIVSQRQNGSLWENYLFVFFKFIKQQNLLNIFKAFQLCSLELHFRRKHILSIFVIY